MRGAPILFAILTALAVSGCMREQTQTYYIVDPQTGRPVPVVTQQQQFTQPQYAQQIPTPGAVQPLAPAANARSLYSASPAYAQQAYAPAPVVQPAVPAPAAQPRASGTSRGLFTSPRMTQSYAQPQVQQQIVQPQQPYIAQYTAPQAAAPPPVVQQQIPLPQYAAPQVAVQPQARAAYASAPASYTPDYTLDSGDKLRVVVFGQDGITNSYMVDAGGNINLPLVGSVPARGATTQQLSRAITDRLKQGYVREPHVSVEVETYRPFFILGEVTTPGQYPYVVNMTAETAVAIAGGFSPRASKSKVQVTRNAPGQQFNGEVPLNFALRPGDTVVVKERWF